jgi:hypothetical protein
MGPPILEFERVLDPKGRVQRAVRRPDRGIGSHEQISLDASRAASE